MKLVNEYFSSARERYRIYQKRFVQKLPPPWTDDKSYQTWSFCNVFREDDVTTAWFRENIRKHTRGIHAVNATVAFRWFNRIETGKVIQDILLSNQWDSKEVLRRLKSLPPDQPVFTGAYMIKSFNGRPKTESIIENIEEALLRIPLMYPTWGSSIQETSTDLSTIPFLGPFMAYEVASDLRHTDVLCNAKDIMTWANTGPGCKHGLGRVASGNPKYYTDPGHMPATQRAYEMLKLMRELLDMSRNNEFWPSEWPKWEMREVEHWACEFDKKCRADAGIPMKRRFLPRTGV